MSALVFSDSASFSISRRIVVWTKISFFVIFYFLYWISFTEKKKSVLPTFWIKTFEICMRMEDGTFFFSIHFRPTDPLRYSSCSPKSPPRLSPSPTIPKRLHGRRWPLRSSLNHALWNEAFCWRNCRGRIKNNSRTTSASPTGSGLTGIRVLLFPEIVNARADRFARHGASCRKITRHCTWKRLSISSSRFFVQCRERGTGWLKRFAKVKTKNLMSIDELLC